MDDALVLFNKNYNYKVEEVLILVVMDDALVLGLSSLQGFETTGVLILVVMDDALVHGMTVLIMRKILES